jgi:hypothetical protein
MHYFEQKAMDNFGSLTINKSLAREAGFGSRAILCMCVNGLCQIMPVIQMNYRLKHA